MLPVKCVNWNQIGTLCLDYICSSFILVAWWSPHIRWIPLLSGVIKPSQHCLVLQAIFCNIYQCCLDIVVSIIFTDSWRFIIKIIVGRYSAIVLQKHGLQMESLLRLICYVMHSNAGWALACLINQSISLIDKNLVAISSSGHIGIILTLVLILFSSFFGLLL